MHIELKNKLTNQYQKWQENIDKKNMSCFDDRDHDRRIKENFQRKIKIHQDWLKFVLLNSSIEKEKIEIKLLIKRLKQSKKELNKEFEYFTNYIDLIVYERVRQVFQRKSAIYSSIQNGTDDGKQPRLPSQWIQKFQRFHS